MASTFTDLGIELMATGENAGTWGNKTNANLNLIEQLTGGYNSQAVTDSGTPTALTIDNITPALLTGLSSTSAVGTLTTTQLSIASLVGLGQTANVTLNDAGISLRYYQRLTPKDSTGYSRKVPKNSTGYTRKVPN